MLASSKRGKKLLELRTDLIKKEEAATTLVSDRT